MDIKKMNDQEIDKLAHELAIVHIKKLNMEFEKSTSTAGYAKDDVQTYFKYFESAKSELIKMQDL